MPYAENRRLVTETVSLEYSKFRVLSRISLMSYLSFERCVLRIANNIDMLNHIEKRIHIDNGLYQWTFI